MPFTNYYDLLCVAPTASQEEVRQAFRRQIARYHPDKVQHLGKEFQDMAAVRATELTEAYRVLSDQDRRAEYDGLLAEAPSALVYADPIEAPTPEGEPSAAPPPETSRAEPDAGEGFSFSQERVIRDEFVKRASAARFRQAVTALGDYDEPSVRGFDIACVPKPKLFGRSKGPRLLARVVSRVDGAAVADAWVDAGKWETPPEEEICVFLMGLSMAPARELADSIAQQRRRGRGRRITMVPIDAQNWNAHVPTDAPAEARSLLTHLREVR